MQTFFKFFSLFKLYNISYKPLRTLKFSKRITKLTTFIRPERLRYRRYRGYKTNFIDSHSKHSKMLLLGPSQYLRNKRSHKCKLLRPKIVLNHKFSKMSISYKPKIRNIGAQKVASTKNNIDIRKTRICKVKPLSKIKV